VALIGKKRGELGLCLLPLLVGPVAIAPIIVASLACLRPRGRRFPHCPRSSEKRW